MTDRLSVRWNYVPQGMSDVITSETSEVPVPRENEGEAGATISPRPSP